MPTMPNGTRQHLLLLSRHRQRIPVRHVLETVWTTVVLPLEVLTFAGHLDNQAYSIPPIPGELSILPAGESKAFPVESLLPNPVAWAPMSRLAPPDGGPPSEPPVPKP